MIIDDGKTLVTNYHVIEEAYYIKAWTADYKKYTLCSEAMAYDERTDLAILKTESSIGVSALILGNSDYTKQGDSVYAVGYPLGISNTLSDGIISAKYLNDGVEYIQITAPISHGSSGGALFDSNGDVIGITCAGYVEGENMNLAIPSNTVKKLIADAKENTKICYTWEDEIGWWPEGAYNDVFVSTGNYNFIYGSEGVGANTIYGKVIGQYIYMVDRQSGEKVFVDNGHGLSAYKGYLYYASKKYGICKYDPEERKIYSLLTDERKAILDQIGDYYVWGIYATEDRLFIRLEDKIISYDLYTGKIQQLLTGQDDISFVGYYKSSMLFLVDYDKLFKIDTKDLTLTEIKTEKKLRDNEYMFIADSSSNGMIWYIIAIEDEGNEKCILYRMDLSDGYKTDRVMESIGQEFDFEYDCFAYDEYLYYFEKNKDGYGLYKLDRYGKSTFVAGVPSMWTHNYIKNGCLYAKDGWVLDLKSGKTSKYIWGE